MAKPKALIYCKDKWVIISTSVRVYVLQKEKALDSKSRTYYCKVSVIYCLVPFLFSSTYRNNNFKY